MTPEIYQPLIDMWRGLGIYILFILVFVGGIALIDTKILKSPPKPKNLPKLNNGFVIYDFIPEATSEYQTKVTYQPCPDNFSYDRGYSLLDLPRKRSRRYDYKKCAHRIHLEIPSANLSKNFIDTIADQLKTEEINRKNANDPFFRINGFLYIIKHDSRYSGLRPIVTKIENDLHDLYEYDATGLLLTNLVRRFEFLLKTITTDGYYLELKDFPERYADSAQQLIEINNALSTLQEDINLEFQKHHTTKFVANQVMLEHVPQTELETSSRWQIEYDELLASEPNDANAKE